MLFLGIIVTNRQRRAILQKQVKNALSPYDHITKNAFTTNNCPQLTETRRPSSAACQMPCPRTITSNKNHQPKETRPSSTAGRMPCPRSAAQPTSAPFRHARLWLPGWLGLYECVCVCVCVCVCIVFLKKEEKMCVCVCVCMGEGMSE